MYNFIKSVISAGGYKLAEVQQKIKKFYALGDISERQMYELLALASQGVSPDAERPDTLAMLQTLRKEIEELRERVVVLENNAGASDDEDASTDEGETSTPDEEANAYPAWEPWNGLSNNYQPGVIVTHTGQLWRSVFIGQNVWEPGATGTEALWEVYEDTTTK